jgi:hypothetical protein
MDNTVSGQQAGQPGNASGQIIQTGEAIAEQQPQEQKFVTREEAEAIAIRTAQSLTDKASSRINNDLKALRASLEVQKAAGIQITAEQQQAAEAQVIKQALVGQETQVTAPASVAGTEQNAPVDPMKYLADQQATNNITIEPGDPEAAILQSSQGPFDWGIKVAEAISKKKARISTQTDQAAARVPVGSGQLAGEPPASSSQDYWRNAHRK